MKPYDFQTQLAAGRKGEAFLDAFFAPSYAITKATEAEQRTEIDRWFIHRASGRRFSVEYKTDSLAGKTGNAFVETVSVDTRARSGWAYMSAAEILMYYLPEPETIYVLRMSNLRQHLPSWLRYPTGKALNKGYWTHGLLVPLHEFERIAVKVY